MPTVRSPEVARLAADPAWQVTVLTGGRWSTAEWSGRHDDHHWVIGLTPVQASVALIVWRDDEMVDHARGDEKTMCAAARAWVSRILVQGNSPVTA
ncbi:hypothetical protein ALI144C_10365 [Actinosynnema sp. ALI-1.44]|nr:hypothetical protein ALI144C_10365 [Actinosynnema sp. ALI-1.44]